MSLQYFNDTCGKFRSEEDKFESLYIFVIRGVTVENTIEKVKKMIGIIDEIGNNVKKHYLKTRLNAFINFVEGGGLETMLNGIYMVYKKVEEIAIHPDWNETLNMFKCENFIVKYGDKFPLDWLSSYLTDRSYLNILQVQNNNIKHIYLNTTKRVMHAEHNEKKCDLNEFVNTNIPKGEYCLIHGVSSFLKQVKDTMYIKVLNGNKRDEELLEEHDKILNEKKSIELQKWLDAMINPDSKDAKKLAFGKEITDAINDHMLKILFCTPKMRKIVTEKIAQEDIIFDIVEIKSYVAGDIGRTLRENFGGAIGIKFY